MVLFLFLDDLAASSVCMGVCVYIYIYIYAATFAK